VGHSKLGNCPQHCKQDLLRKVGVAAHADISKKFAKIYWIILVVLQLNNRLISVYFRFVIISWYTSLRLFQ
jgi:hypothetical protein